MGEEKNQEQQEKDRTESTEEKPDTEKGKDATDERVANEEESGGALPQNRSDES